MTINLKDLRAIAEVIAKIKNPYRRKKTALEIGLILRRRNTRFDWSRWDTACKTDTL